MPRRIIDDKEVNGGLPVALLGDAGGLSGVKDVPKGGLGPVRTDCLRGYLPVPPMTTLTSPCPATQSATSLCNAWLRGHILDVGYP